MPLPDRPVSHASIESVWGQQVHDYTFAPSGCAVHGAAGASVGTSYAGLPLDTVDADPGGYLDAGSDAVEVPTGGEGLYVVMASYRVSGSSDGVSVTGNYAINGTVLNGCSISCETGGASYGSCSNIHDLSAGDIFTVQARRIGAGTNPTVQCLSFRIIRIGAEWGA